jgi:hypothetical protein
MGNKNSFQGLVNQHSHLVGNEEPHVLGFHEPLCCKTNLWSHSFKSNVPWAK